MAEYIIRQRTFMAQSNRVFPDVRRGTVDIPDDAVGVSTAMVSREPFVVTVTWLEPNLLNESCDDQSQPNRGSRYIQ